MEDQYVTFSAARFTLSLINAGLAQGKGRSGANWWLVSLFLGPFATFLIVISGRGDAAPGEPAEGKMTQSQAVVIGVVVVLVALAIAAVFAFMPR